MVHSKDFLKHCPTVAGFSIMGDYSPSSVKKMTNPSLSKVNPRSTYQSPPLANFYSIPIKS